MYSLALAVLFVAASGAFLTIALHRFVARPLDERPTAGRRATAVGACYLAAVPVWWLAQPYLATDDDIGGPTAFFGAVWVFSWAALFFLGNRRVGRTTLRWLGFGVPVLFVGLFFTHVVESYVLQTTRAAMVDMLPSIRSSYTVQACPNCGGEFVVRAYPITGSDGTVRHNERFRKHGVCQNCYHPEDVSEHKGPFRGPDHFVVNHLRAPERWRLVAFGAARFPIPSRLVGLPGETVVIRDGAVWVNGTRQEPPAALGPLRYNEVVPRPNWKGEPPTRARMFAHPEEPLALGADEYFLLDDDPGDLSDGRLGGPVRWKDYLGVVDVVFWPPARWRFLP